MNSHDRKTILKMIEHCDHIQEYTAECSAMEDFEKNTMMVEAGVFNLVQLGELAHGLKKILIFYPSDLNKIVRGSVGR